MKESHVLLPGSKRVVPSGAKLVGRANQHGRIDVTVKIRRKKSLPELTSRPDRLFTSAEIGDEYGAAKEDIDKAVLTLERTGLVAESVNARARTVHMSGSVAAAENAFQVRLFNYEQDGEVYRGRSGHVYAPADLRGVVEGVFGLDNRRVAYRRRRRPTKGGVARNLSSVPSSWYLPSQLASHYNFPDGDGSGQSVGLLEFGGGYFEQDLRQFCELADIPVPTVTPVSTDGTSTNALDGTQGEVMLDIEVVAGLCSRANIVPYFAHWSEQGWIKALDYVVQDSANNPSVVSISWGLAEDTDIWSSQAMLQVNETLKEAAYQGITVCVSAGDDGSSDGVDDGYAHVDFPAASPYVLAVGGTAIVNGDNGKVDVAWKEGDGLRADNGGATGGGVSAYFSRPPWQTTIALKSVNPGGIVGRCVPDVAANADWDASPYLLVVGGQAQPNGGTSAASPLWAGLVARMNQIRKGKRVGFLAPLLYGPIGNGNGSVQAGSIGCTDVLTGDNATDASGGYSAGPGFDAVSGWGTPNGTKLLSLIP